MYTRAILNIFENPKNAGRLQKPDGIAENYNLDQTAHVEFSIRVENGIIIDCKFRAQANPAIIAACSLLAESVKGKMTMMLFFDLEKINSDLGLDEPLDLNFCVDCIKLAIDDYKSNLQKANKD